jgi:hypothetical protein
MALCITNIFKMQSIPWSFPVYGTSCAPTRFFLFDKLSANEREAVEEFKNRILIDKRSVYVTDRLMTRRFLTLAEGGH